MRGSYTKEKGPASKSGAGPGWKKVRDTHNDGKSMPWQERFAPFLPRHLVGCESYLLLAAALFLVTAFLVAFLGATFFAAFLAIM